jgi:hypothetical protein
MGSIFFGGNPSQGLGLANRSCLDLPGRIFASGINAGVFPASSPCPTFYFRKDLYTFTVK